MMSYTGARLPGGAEAAFGGAAELAGSGRLGFATSLDFRGWMPLKGVVGLAIFAVLAQGGFRAGRDYFGQFRARGAGFAGGGRVVASVWMARRLDRRGDL